MISLATVFRIAKRNQNKTGVQFEVVTADGAPAIRRIVIGLDNGLHRAELIEGKTARELWKKTNSLARANSMLKDIILDEEEVAE